MCSSGKAKRVKWSPVCVCVSSLFYIYGRWVKLLSLSEKASYITYTEKKKKKKKRGRELRKEEGEVEKRTSTGAGNYAKRPVGAPTGRESLWPYFFFIFSLFFSSLFSSRYGSFSFKKNHFSAPSFSRDSDITPRFTHTKKNRQRNEEKKKERQQTNTFLWELLIVLFFSFLSPYLYIFLCLLLRERKSHSSLLL